MDDSDFFPRMDRRKAMQWMLAATAGMAVHDADAAAEGVKAQGYGPDPSMVKLYKPGDVWPLTLSQPQRHCAAALCDVIVPADDDSPSASAVGVHDFIDEWISSPYPDQAGDRRVVLEGLQRIDDEAKKRFHKMFAELSPEQQMAICTDLASAKPKAEHKKAAGFFKRYRDLTAGGYFTTPEGMKAIGYIGNMPSGTFGGPPLEALKHVGLA